MKPVIEILMNEKGQVFVKAPMDKALLCLGLLETAKHIILNPQELPETNKVVVVPAGVGGDLKAN